ncbi:hypothetical protein LEP1GSC050_2537 [Leptospira broomii serovar Hurstbridge str. 5399]|uniref:Uncharacterized protein n=1 Tax=Leptospira broomii serovar Hurstbridge str. 5399 TaxID=1049789 RepID=T0GH88_9LEPT|nr:hypothetical protein [Leptospira broomii]EQA46209.1 hypothetical protein LEP1GSC050_2537 [Leptospira broomii serovar Hurstbridge str. 5399]
MLRIQISFGAIIKKCPPILILWAFTAASSVADLQTAPEIGNITDFRTDRLAFHYIQLVDKDGKALSDRNAAKDNSESTLVIIERGQLTLLKDGFDDPAQVREKEREYLEKIYRYTRLRELEQEYRKLPEAERSQPTSSQVKNPSQNSDVKNSASDNAVVVSANIGELEQRSKEFDLLLKFDEELLKSYGAEKSAYAEYSRSERIYGKDSPRTGALRNRYSELKDKTNSRKKFLLDFLRNPGQETNPYPGERKEQSVFTNHMNGAPDYYLHSTSPREVDGLMIGEEEVGKKYGELYKKGRDRLIDAEIDKLYYYLWNRDMTNTRIKVDKYLKGKKVVVITGDSTVYTMIDKEGDGITESFFVDSPGLRFSWGRDIPNILSISNCTDEFILAKIKALADDVASGRVPKRIEKLDITIPEEQILEELRPLLKNL